MINKKKVLDYEINFPQGYRPKTYLRSHGTEYILSDYVINDNTAIELKVDNTTFNTAQASSIYVGQSLPIWNQIGNTRFGTIVFARGGDQKTSTLITGEIVIKQTAKDSNGIVKNYINDTLVCENSDLTETVNQKNAYIFSSEWQNNADNKANIKLFYLKFYENGVLVRNYVPAQRRSDNVLGLLDLVNLNFFPNQGTGNFESD